MGHTGGGGQAPTANAVTVKVVKNKCAPPFRQVRSLLCERPLSALLCSLTHTRARAVAHTHLPPTCQAQFAIRFGVGICKLSEVLELAIEAGYIKQGGIISSSTEEVHLSRHLAHSHSITGLIHRSRVH